MNWLKNIVVITMKSKHLFYKKGQQIMKDMIKQIMERTEQETLSLCNESLKVGEEPILNLMVVGEDINKVVKQLFVFTTDDPFKKFLQFGTVLTWTLSAAYHKNSRLKKSFFWKNFYSKLPYFVVGPCRTREDIKQQNFVITSTLTWASDNREGLRPSDNPNRREAIITTAIDRENTRVYKIIFSYLSIVDGEYILEESKFNDDIVFCDMLETPHGQDIPCIIRDVFHKYKDGDILTDFVNNAKNILQKE